MSRIGKNPITIPSGVQIQVDGRKVAVKGPKGQLDFEFNRHVDVKSAEDKVIVSQIGNAKESPAHWGTTRSIIQNMITGVVEGYSKQLELHGVGFKMAIQGKKLVFNLGFSHPVEMEIGEGLEASIEKNVLSIRGIDKQKVGQFTAEIRSLKKVEPYKGKGFRYVGEQFIKKEGKRAVGEK